MNKSPSNTSFSAYSSNSKYYFILFLLWPFLAFLIALKNYSKKEAKIVVYLFLIYYGLNFSLVEIGYVDAVGYAKELEAFAKLPLKDFSNAVGGLYNANSSVDIYQPFITFIVSRFTSSHKILFAVFAAVFGFFYLKSINILYDLYRKNPGLNALIFFIFFIAILPVTEINGVRMWTAAWVFFYGAIQVVLYRDKRYLLLALASSFVHFSFISANIILIIYYIAGNRRLIYFTLALLSFVVPQLINPVFQFVALQFGGNLQGKYASYSSQGYILERQEGLQQTDWFIQIGNDLVYYYLILAIIVIQIIQISSENLKKEKNGNNLYNFLLLFMAFVNFAKPTPSFGSRFQIVFFLFATFYIFQFFAKIKNLKISILTLIGLFPMLLYVAITFRIGSKNLNTWLFTPGFGIPWLVPDQSVADLLFF